MLRHPIESLGAMVRKKRGQRKLRETAREIGVGPATLMRVESGRIPDVETFGKLCGWLGEDPKQFLGLTDLEKRPSPNQEAVATFAGLSPFLASGTQRSDRESKKAIQAVLDAHVAAWNHGNIKRFHGGV